MKVFISYAREDWEIAERFWKDLKNAGIDAWIDRKELKPAQRWKAEISRAIRVSSHFIALLSTRSVSKQGFFHTELKKAIEVLDTVSEREICFIPVRIDDCEPPYERLEDIHWADLFPCYEEGLNQILGVLVPDSPETAETDNIPENPVKPAKVVKTEEKPVPQPRTPKPKYPLRKEPMTVSDKEVPKVFKLKKDSDGRWRPLEYIQNDFKDNQDGIITDHATGLMWQKSGSPNWLYLKDVPAYIEKLNREKFAGHSDWRLPTTDELKSLLTPEKQSNDLFISPVFDKEQQWCWTSDKRASGGAWLVGFDGGSVGWVDVNSYFVRAVRSGQ